MPDRDAYAPGTPSWVDLSSPDLDASAAFYGGLFGWQAVEPGPIEQTGGYRMFQLRGKDVAGLGPVFGEGQPPAWATYISVDDVEAAARRVENAGGKVLSPPMDVMDVGRMAVFADDSGTVFSVWEAGSHPGARIVNEPGTLCWSELGRRDPEPARAFYGQVFGWVAKVNPIPGTATSSYTEFSLAEGQPPVAGMIQMNEQWPQEIRPHWMTYFAVADCDATAARAVELGGAAPVPPFDMPIGRIAVLKDPHEAHFSIIALASQPRS